MHDQVVALLHDRFVAQSYGRLPALVHERGVTWSHDRFNIQCRIGLLKFLAIWVRADLES
jgi:hypothetical protein